MKLFTILICFLVAQVHCINFLAKSFAYMAGQSKKFCCVKIQYCILDNFAAQAEILATQIGSTLRKYWVVKKARDAMVTHRFVVTAYESTADAQSDDVEGRIIWTNKNDGSLPSESDRETMIEDLYTLGKRIKKKKIKEAEQADDEIYERSEASREKKTSPKIQAEEAFQSMLKQAGISEER